jgi:hypothetical protein
MLGDPSVAPRDISGPRYSIAIRRSVCAEFDEIVRLGEVLDHLYDRSSHDFYPLITAA